MGKVGFLAGIMSAGYQSLGPGGGWSGTAASFEGV